MTPEREPLQWAEFSLTGDRQGQVLVHATHRQVKLHSEQIQLLKALKEAGTIEKMVLHQLTQGRLISFSMLHDLMQILTSEAIVLNSSWREMWIERGLKGWVRDHQRGGAKITEEQLLALPFFHRLNKTTLTLFSGLAQRYSCDANTQLCVQGQKTRSLFILVDGEAAVFGELPPHPKRMLARLAAPAIFGEGGFLLNKPRTADVVTTRPSQVICIRHSHAVDELIKSGQAELLERRFWVLHALSVSELFRSVPLDAWDELATLGDLKNLKDREVLFQERSQGASFFILIQGQLSVWQNEKKINHLNQGSCLGEIALLASRGVRTATVRAEAPCLVLEIPAHQFYPLLARHLPLANELEALAKDRMGRDSQRTER